MANDYLVLDPENEYNTIEPNTLDSKADSTDDYFILEPGAPNSYGTSNDKDYDYNKINLKAHGIVKDPNYQRLAAVDQNHKYKASIDNENYSYLGTCKKFIVDGDNGQIHTVHDKNADYEHLNNNDHI